MFSPVDISRREPEIVALELGEKGVLWLEVEKGRTEAEFVPLCRRRYQILSVDLILSWQRRNLLGLRNQFHGLFLLLMRAGAVGPARSVYLIWQK